ncbi:MAG: SprT family zinc-dependent metalloprotease [bacterium]
MTIAPDNQHIMQFGSAEIVFTLILTERRSLKISVAPDRKVLVEAPAIKSIADVLERVRRRGAWIIRQLEYFRRFQPLPTPRQYVSGETHLYLGRQYRLKLILNEGKEEVKLIRGYFQVYIHDINDRIRIKRLLIRWYDEHGRIIITDRLLRCQAELERYNVPAPTTITFRRMEKRWGSCTKAGGLLFNTELAHVPVPCIDYVVTHELCHLKHPNHSPAFYALLTQVMPDWRQRKERLETAVL